MEVTVASRTSERAKEIADDVGCRAVDWDGRYRKPYDCIINFAGLGFDNIEAVIGSSAGTDHLTGREVDAYWEVDNTNRYISFDPAVLDPIDYTGTENNLTARRQVALDAENGVSAAWFRILDFASFETLQGGSANDVFRFANTNSLDALGGGDVDYFMFSDGAVLNSFIDGESGCDTFDEYEYASARDYTVTALGLTDGFTITEPASIHGTATNIDELVGSSTAVDTLTGLDEINQWTVNLLPEFSQYISANTLYFAHIDTLLGGSAADTFTIADTVTLTGHVDGNGGDDILDMGPYATARTFTLTGAGLTDGYDGTASGITGGFHNINDLVGSAAANDTLVGLDVDNEWLIDGPVSGSYTVVNTLKFSGVENLTGGIGVDHFAFTGNGTVGGTLTGGDGLEGFGSRKSC